MGEVLRTSRSEATVFRLFLGILREEMGFKRRMSSFVGDVWKKDIDIFDFCMFLFFLCVCFYWRVECVSNGYASELTAAY